jgi:hypothetical protein
MTMMAAALVLAACEDGAGPNFSGAPSATLSFAVAGAGDGAVPFGGPSAVVITDGAGRVLDVTQLQVVMEELELERANHDDCVNDDDACEEFETGPVLVDLPVEGGVISPFDVPIPADTYDELELEIDDAEDDSTSAAFFAAHPTWPHDASVRIVGTFDANDGAGPQPFDVYLEVDVEIERNLVPPLVVTDSSSSVNVTVAVDVGSWFLRESGDLIDPRLLDSDGGLADEVEGNIESSFDAYEDDDHDGEDDDSDDDGIDDEDEDDA